MATRMFAQGTAGDNAPLMRYKVDTAAHQSGWPLLEDASQVDFKDPVEVQAHANGELTVEVRRTSGSGVVRLQAALR